MLRVSRTVSAAVRVATVDTQILGHHIPKGNSVIMLLNGWSSLGGEGFEVDEEVRGLTGKDRVRSWDEDDIRQFRPERWLVADDTSAAGTQGRMVFDANAGPSLPMSAGPRGCFGESTRALSPHVSGCKYAALRIYSNTLLTQSKANVSPT